MDESASASVAARPASSVTTRKVAADTIWKATIAATAATQPTRLLTGLLRPEELAEDHGGDRDAQPVRRRR